MQKLHLNTEIHQLKKLKLIIAVLHVCRVGIRYISLTYLLDKLTDTVRFMLLGLLFHNIAHA